MASINMDGCQSFILNDIKNEMRQGRNVTHVLNVKISRQGEAGTGNRIRSAIFGRMANRTITKIVHGQQVTVTWRTSAKRTSAYYFCESEFNNINVVGHAKVLLKDIIEDIDATFQGIFTRGETGIAFIVTIPAKYTMQTVQLAPDHSGDAVGENENENEVDVEQILE
jgi:hypothetical protein